MSCKILNWKFIFLCLVTLLLLFSNSVSAQENNPSDEAIYQNLYSGCMNHSPARLNLSSDVKSEMCQCAEIFERKNGINTPHETYMADRTEQLVAVLKGCTVMAGITNGISEDVFPHLFHKNVAAGCNTWLTKDSNSGFSSLPPEIIQKACACFDDWTTRSNINSVKNIMLYPRESAGALDQCILALIPPQGK